MYVKNILGLLTVTLDYYKVFEDLSKWRHISFMRHTILTKNADIDLARNHPKHIPLAVCQRKMHSKRFEHLKCLFNIAYYIAKFNKPLTDFKNLIALLNKHDVDTGPGRVVEEYQNDMKCKEFVSVIADIIKQELVKEIKDSSTVSLLLDASTDISTEEELVLYTRYTDKNWKLKEAFVSIIPLQNSTAAGYLEREMEKLFLPWKTGNWLVGIGTDGASDMLGKNNGLVAKLKRYMPDLIPTHCIAHKLNLAVINSIKDVPFLSEIETVVTNYIPFTRFTKKTERTGKNSNHVTNKNPQLQVSAFSMVGVQ
jgi:hypothetical protein